MTGRRKEWLRMLSPASPAEFCLAWDMDGQIIAASDAVAVLLDRRLTAVIGTPIADLVPSSDDLSPGDGLTIKVRSTLGASLWIDGAVNFSGGVTTLRGYDVTARESADSVLTEYAYTDSMTALQNRAGFLRFLDQGLRSRIVAGVVFCDLDDFKTVNDSLGHALGDLLLLEAVSRIRGVVGDWGEESVGRMGGDEFAIAVPGAPNDVIALGSTAQQVLDAFREPFQMGERSVTLTVSVGVAPVSGLDQDHSVIMQQADTAMYRAKGQGKNKAITFDEAFEVAARNRLDIEEALHQAVDEHQFVAHYQPEFGIESGRMELVEALVRWDRPGHGIVSPFHFVTAAEECGLIVALGEEMLEMATVQGRRWYDEFGDLAPAVSVNVAAPQVDEGRIVRAVKAALADTGLPPHLLRLELTETSLADPEETGPVLERLKEMGCRVAIDDFGTGYSSLAYLAKLPVDDIKIDKAFIDEIHKTGTAPLVDTILAMGKALGMHVDAEGIEKPHQLEYLRARNCTRIQGYLLGKPMPADEITTLLASAAARANGPLRVPGEDDELVIEDSAGAALPQGLTDAVLLSPSD